MNPLTTLSQSVASTSNPLLTRLVYASLDVLVVGLLVWLACAVLRPRSPRVRSLLWLLVPAKGLVALFLGSWFVMGIPQADRQVTGGPLFEPLAAAESPMVMVGDSTAPSMQLLSSESSTAPVLSSPRATIPMESPTRVTSVVSFTQFALGAWLLGALLFFALSVRDRIRGTRLVRRASPMAPEVLQFVRRQAEAFGVRVPAIRSTAELDSPALVGSLRPVILIPQEMQSRSTLEWAIRHELMHLALRDPWAALVREAGRIAFFFHPVLRLAGRKWGESAELACDMALVHEGDDSIDYADQLHALADRVCRRPNPAMAHGLFAARSCVGRRIQALIDLSPGDAAVAKLSRAAAAKVSILFAATLSMGAGLVHLSQDPSDYSVSGRVVAQDGSPVAQAQVVATYWDSNKDLMRKAATVLTDAEGRFVMQYERTDLLNNPRYPDFHESVIISAHAEGHGLQWQRYGDIVDLNSVTLKLAEDFELRGRIVDTDGQPIAGATVRGYKMAQSAEHTLDPWISAIASGKPWHQAIEALTERARFSLDIAPVTRTDEKGAFKLRGIGDERIVGVEFVGGGAALGSGNMATRVLDEQLLDAHNEGAFQPVQNMGGTLVAQRTRPIEGFVFDDVTGKPMEGVNVMSYALADGPFGSMLDSAHKLRTKTDADGRFRLLGISKGSGNSVIFVTPEDQPYLARVMNVPDTDGMDPIELRAGLHRGIWITGRVLNGATGQPAHGRVTYYPHMLNKPVSKIAQFKDFQIDGGDGRVTTRPDGTFRIVGLPGAGLVAVEVPGDYHQGAGFDPEWGVNDSGGALVYGSGGRQPGPDWPTAMCAIEAAVDAEATECSLTVFPGVTVVIDVGDEQGQPVQGMQVVGRWSRELRVASVEGSKLTIRQLGPSEERHVSVRSVDGRLGGTLVVRAADADARRKLGLMPTASMSGRLLDQDGVPMAKASIGVHFLSDQHYTGIRSATDSEGHYTIKGLIPGADYRLSVETFGAFTQFTDRKDVKPGERLELGVHRVELPED